MKDSNYNVDSKENLGHGIKGEINTTANNLKNDKNNTNNKITNDMNKKK